jgi:hypothetical protein
MKVRPQTLLAMVYFSTAFMVKQPFERFQRMSPSSPLTISKHPSCQAISSNNNKSSLTSQSLFPDCASFILAEQSSLSLRNTDVWIFIAGLIPFGWATIEFWRRIAVGEPFGTGKDSVYIGKDGVPKESRGRRVLDRGAFLVAYLLFGIAAAAIAITLISVVTSPPMGSSSLAPPS